MAGGGLCRSLAAVHLCEGMKGGSTLIFVWVVLLVSMETPTVVAVESKCSFEGRYLPSIQALELSCQCPQDTTDFKELTPNDPIKIGFWKVSDKNGSGKWFVLYDSLSKKAILPDVKVVTDEPGGPGLRAKETLRRMNYTAQPGDVNYTCKVEGRRTDGDLGRKCLSLSKIEGFPIPDSARIPAASGKTEDGFSTVGLYVTVGLSCVLLIVIVSAIICFVRVRAQRRREKEEVEEGLELENCRPHAANVSVDQEDLTRRNERLDTPRRPRSRDPVPTRRHPGLSRSFDVLDREETPHGRGVRPHRFFPRNSYDETSDEDMTDPGHHHRRHPAYYRPPRSRSQDSLQRHRGRGYSPVWTSTGPRPDHAVSQHDYDEDQFQTPRVPHDYRYVYGDSQPQHPARRVRSRQAVSDDRWPPESAGSHEGETSGAETTEPDYPPEPAGRDLRAEREAAVFQQQPRYPQDGPQPSGSTPSCRRPRYASSPSRSRHYSTTSSPRRPSDERRSRSARHPRHNLSHPHLFYLSDSGANTEPCLHPEVASEDLLRPAHYSTCRSQSRPQHGKSRRRSRPVGNITDGRADSVPRHQHPRGGGRRGISPERPAPQVAFQEVPPSSAEGGQRERPMNVLSRDRLSPSHAVPPPLNVPFMHEQPVRGPSAATGQQQLGDSTPRQTPGADVPARAPTANTGEDASRPSGSHSRGVARPSDPLPNTSPPQEGGSLSFSDNNDSQLSASRGHRLERATVAEIEVRDIKTDHETRRKRPLSVKVNNHNGRAPVACVADMAESLGGVAPPAVTATARGRRQEERRERGPRPGSSEPGHEECGGQVMPSLENTGNGQLFRFAEDFEHNQITSAKTFHPRPE